MATPRFAWGIDVGNRALKAVKLVREGDVLRIDDVDVIEHEHILSDAGDNKESLVTQSLSTFAQKHPEKGGAVAIGVSGQSSFARFIKLPPVEDKRIPEIVRFEAIQQIPFPLDDVEWSYQLFQDEGSPEKEVGIFAMRKELVNHHIKNFTDAGLNVQAVQMNPLAVYNAMYHDERIKGATMIVDVGAENTDLIIAEGESIWLRSIPVGGNNFTEALVKQFKLKFPKAEDLKRNAATSKYTRQILQAMRPVFDSLVSEIQRSIGFYASVHRESKIARVIALGGTFRLPGLLKFLQMQLQLDVQRLDTLAAAPPTDPRVATLLNDNLLSLVAPYGLALQVMEQAKINSSLLPLAIRRERMWREKTKWFAAAAALVLCGTGGVALGRYFYEDMRYASAAPARSKVESELSAAKSLDARWKEVEQAGVEDRENIAKMQGTTMGRGLQAEILLAIDNALPEPQSEPVGKRPERKVVMVENLTENYLDDLTPVLELTQPEFIAKAAGGGGGRRASGGLAAAMGMGGGPGGARPDAAAGMKMMMGGDSGGDTADAAPAEVETGKKRGYLVTLVCTTPMPQRAATTIAQAVRQALVDQTAPDPASTERQKFRIERVEIVSVRRAAADEDAPRARGRRGAAARRNNRGGRGAGRGLMQNMGQANQLPGGANPGAMAASGMNRMGGMPAEAQGDPSMAGAGMGMGDGAYGAGPRTGGATGRSGNAARGAGGRRAAEEETEAPAFEMPQLDFDDLNATEEDENKKPTDPVTGEDASSDQRVTFLVAVVLDPEPPAPPEGAEGAPGAEDAAAAEGPPDGVPPEGAPLEGAPPDGAAPQGDEEMPMEDEPASDGDAAVPAAAGDGPAAAEDQLDAATGPGEPVDEQPEQ